MNCRTAQSLLSAERDGALSSGERAAFEAHVGACAACQRARTALASQMAHVAAISQRAPVPDVERAWQDIRREIRQEAARTSQFARFSLRWTVPVGLAAALAIAFSFRSTQDATPAPQPSQLAQARADFVEVPTAAASMVYVDNSSGWLVVWAVDDPAPTR